MHLNVYQKRNNGGVIGVFSCDSWIFMLHVQHVAACCRCMGLCSMPSLEFIIGHIRLWVRVVMGGIRVSL